MTKSPFEPLADPESPAVSETPVGAPSERSQYRPLRVWIAVALMLGMLVLRFLPKLIKDGPPQLWMSAAFGPLLCSVVMMVFWWLMLSRATWKERLVGFLGVGVALGGTMATMHPTMRGPASLMLTIPMGVAAFGIGAVLFGRIKSFRRTAFSLVLAVLAFGFSTLLQSDGMWGNFALGLDWRWNPTGEDKLIADRANQAEVTIDDLATDPDAALKNPEWPGFRGGDRTGRVTGLKIDTDWKANPPKEIWRTSVGPGWSSFVVAGSMLFTQEQRKEQEYVVCYDADTGNEVWATGVEARLDDPLGGPGPRATPALVDGKLYTLGSVGHLQKLDAKTGDVEWKQDLRKVAGRQQPMWGFCSSPAVVGSTVIVHSGGSGEKGTLAFDKETGELNWSAASGDHSYSSPQLCKIDGTELLLMLSNTGLELLDPQSGETRLNYEWKHGGYRALQPQVVDGDSILIPTGLGSGTRRVRIIENDGKLISEELWTSRYMKPDFNDLVVYDGHAYGFDGAIFTCIDLSDGSKKWKGGRYGNGQVVLIEDSGVLFVISEKGKGVLLKASPDKHAELASMKMLSGKTWNHPVIVGNRLYVRNSKEAACYELQ